MRSLWLGILLIIASHLSGQDVERYFENDSLIDHHASAENFDSLMMALNVQFEFLRQNGHEDSLFQYTYKYGRARTELAGTRQGMLDAEAFVEKVLAVDPNKSHQLNALNDLSWIYIEAGEDSLCFVTDLRYLNICQSYPEASIDEQYMSHYSLGFDYELMGMSAQAIHHFREALKPVLTDSLNYLDQVMDAYNGLGAAQWRGGNLGDAKRSFQRSIDYSRYDKDSLNAFMYQANALGNISLVYEDEGDLVKSKECLEKSLAIRQTALESIDELYQRDQQTRHLIRNYHNLSALYLTLGDLERSKQAQDYCVELRRRQFDENHPDHAKSSEAYGSIAFARGDYQEALGYYQQSLKEMEIGFGAESPYAIVAHERLAKTYRLTGKLDEALDESTKAIELRKRVGDKSQELAKDYLERARIYQADGRIKDALRDLAKAERIFIHTRREFDPVFGLVYFQKGELLRSENIDSALHYLNRSIEIGEAATKELGIKHSRIMSFLPQAYALSARIIADRGELHQAMDFGKKATELLKKARRTYQDDVSKLALFEGEQFVFDTCIDIAFELYFLTADHKMLEQAFKLQEERKTILLRDQLNKFSSIRFSSVPDSLLITEYQLMDILSGKNEDVTPDEILKAEKEYEGLMELYQASFPAYYSLRYEDEVVELDAVRAYALENKLNIVEYVITDQHAYGMLISADTILVLNLEIGSLIPSLKQYNQLITGMNDSLFQVSHRIYTHLFHPFERALTGNRVVIVPDRNLFNLNFETLVQDLKMPAKSYLIYDYQLSYALSASTTIQFENLERKKGSRLLAIAPGFSDQLKEDYITSIDDSVFIDQAYLNSIQQPFSVQTAQRVAKSFGGKSLVDSFATESQFQTQANDYQILHLGTHTEINNVSPLMSKFVLAKSQEGNQDGYLHAYEIYNMELRAELAVLTACETGIGKESTSEGALSIAHSFAYAGCPSIILSIWQIDEKSSSEIIEAFYKKLGDGDDKAAALRGAKLDYLSQANDELSHPYYWSGLVLMGDRSPMVQAESSWIYWMLGLISVIVIVLIQKKRREASS